AQLHQRESLDSISENLRANEDFQAFLEIDPVHPSTLHRKLERLPIDYLKSLYESLVVQVGKHHASKCGLPDIGVLNIIDASEIRLPGRAKWAYASKEKNGVKLHTRLKLIDLKTTLSDKVVPSTAAVSDKEAVEHLVDDKNATYVFDRGYIKYHLYHQWDQDGIHFVARVNANSRLSIVSEQVTDKESILTDAKVVIRDPEQDQSFYLRLIEYVDDKQRKYRVVTNRWDLEASDIAEIYRLRWRIELFFKWIKQHLKVVKWFNHKPEAVWNQIYIIMIAYALCEWIKILSETTKTTWEVLKLLRHYWFSSWERFMEVLHRRPTRSSKGRKKKGKPGRPRKHPKKYKPKKVINF
ncbi:IS4 family transposase, partial [Bacillus marinisedimentorum]|uniref:IS4 family transposase n=1 Tax=Bacillus marinisedimentorum TaxID=1821260 RepID=UPI0007DF5E97